MACKLQKLFSVEAEFEDEEFLMAVSDVEKEAVDTKSVHLRGLRPLSAGLRASSSAIASAKHEGTNISPMLQVQSCSRLQFGEGTCSPEVKSNQRLPLITSLKIQKDLTTLPVNCKSSSNSGKIFKFVNRPATVFPTGTAPCNELDNELSLTTSLDLEETEIYPGFFRSDCGSQKQMKDNIEMVKKQVANSVILTNPVDLDNSQTKRARKETVEEAISNRQPVEVSSEVTLRPTIMDSGISQTNLRVSKNNGSLPNSSFQKIKSLQASADTSISEFNSPWLPHIRPCSAYLSANTSPGLPKSQILSPNCSGSRMASNSDQLHITYCSPVATMGTSPIISKANVGNLQIPVVTNHLVRLVTAAANTPQPMTHVPQRTRGRRFPGPAGILPQQPNGKNLDEILIATPQMPTHGAMAKLQTEEMPTSLQPIEEEFERGPWVAMKNELELDEGDQSCFLRTYSIVMVLRKAALKQLPKNKVPNMAVMIKSLLRTNVDAGAEFKDRTGEMQGTIHRLLLEEKESEFKIGSVLLLRQVSVFSPSHRNHYLNVTPSNLVKIYPPGFSSGNPSQLHREVREAMATVTSQKDPPTSAMVSMMAADDRNVEGCEMDKSLISASERSSSLTPAPGICGASKSAKRADLDDLDQLFSELPDDFFSSLEEQSSL